MLTGRVYLTELRVSPLEAAQLHGQEILQVVCLPTEEIQGAEWDESAWEYNR